MLDAVFLQELKKKKILIRSLTLITFVFLVYNPYFRKWFFSKNSFTENKYLTHISSWRHCKRNQPKVKLSSCSSGSRNFPSLLPFHVHFSGHFTWPTQESRLWRVPFVPSVLSLLLLFFFWKHKEVLKSSLFYEYRCTCGLENVAGRRGRGFWELLPLLTPHKHTHTMPFWNSGHSFPQFQLLSLAEHLSATWLEFVSTQTIDHQPITRQMTVNYPLH